MYNKTSTATCFSYDDLDAHKLKSEIEGEAGFALVTNTPIANFELPEAKECMLALSQQFGQPLSQDKDNALTWLVHSEGQRLFEPDGQLTKNLSSRSNEALPFHTDGSAGWYGHDIDWLLMAAFKADKNGGTTLLLDAVELLARLSAKKPNSAARLCQPVPFDRSNEIFPGQSAINWKPMFAYEHGRLRARLNPTRVRDTAFKLNLDDPELFRSLDDLEEQMQAEDLHTTIHLNAGDCLFINDRRVAHARTAFTSTDRMLIRIWIQTNA